MGLRGWIIKKTCKHAGEDLALDIIEYNTCKISCTAVAHEIICSRCGFVFVGQHQFDWVVELLRKSKYLQTPHAEL